jgi:glycolate oxidase iron-sulfur subunit
MQTQLTPQFLSTEEGREAETTLRNCVHCGFCTATCPTYQLLGDELDGPRGRIYQIKQLLEGAAPSNSLQQHLDRCLLCRSCETTCPSGVAYGRLLETGRNHLEQIQPRKPFERIQRRMLREILPYPKRFGPLMKLARPFKGLLPARIAKSIPSQSTAAGLWPQPSHQRRMLILEGCVQPELAPVINTATARVLERLGISLERTPQAGCCGAVNQHLGDPATALEMVRRNIDAWWPRLKAGAEAIVINASGCGQMVKEYGHLLRADPEYAEKARDVAAATRDLAEILVEEDLSPLDLEHQDGQRIAYHAPCTLQHGQKLPGIVEGLLQKLGFKLTPVENPHLCCGSAGTYSILQPELASRLGRQKARSLEQGSPTLIATANIGCLNHLNAETELPVIHWIELLDSSLRKQ